MADAAPSAADVATSLAAATIADGQKPEQAAGGAGEAGETASKSAAKKDAKAAKKAERLAARQAQQQQQQAAAEEEDPLAANYGDLPPEEVQSKCVSGRQWARVADLVPARAGEVVLVRGRVHNVRAKGKMGFIVVREGGCTVQCVLAVGAEGAHVSKGMVKYAAGLSRESVVDVTGEVVVPEKPIESTSQQVELHVRAVHAVSRALPVLPLNIDDAARSEKDIEDAEKAGVQYVRVGQDTRLNNRVLDLRTPANQAIFRVQSAVSQLFREYLTSQGFIEIHTPKLIGGSSEGGAAVFRLDYKGQAACLAQSPQLYKQMAVCADLGRVFEIGPVFRAEDSFTHRHLCEFTGMDFEMEIREHYSEIMDVINDLFVAIFDGLNTRCAKELAAINHQYPFEPLKYTKEGVRITFPEGMALLKEAGYEVDAFGDINTEQEKKLGELVKQKYGVDFYIMHRYPMAARPFYTMPCPDDGRYTNSFDVFIRGEEILSGAQRIHDADFLARRATECGIDVKTIAPYIDSFRFGAVPHGGIGVGLERVVMLFCGLNNIRKSSMFPRDPQRLAP
ncbi:hypothetical protein CLOM_g5200 [Closterium sp. NIES-68]|nr:hypothetical protein CLOM_g5200 [Closterium sp. NIES-68]GJP69683.1 hypothetical protein CLOP_g670 [Closterium sp. NIES-67]